MYYLTDKDGPVGLNRYDTQTGQESEVVKGSGFDLKSATGGPDCIAVERLGSIWVYELGTKSLHPVPITVHADLPEVRTEFKDVRGNIQSIGLSPSGQRALVAARGWVFTVPAKKGSTRLLDGAQGVFRRDPAWSPDGKSIAYVTDESGVQKLAIRDLASGKDRLVVLGDPPAFYERPVWSPDSKKIAYTDTRLQLWVLDVDSGKNTLIDAGTYRGDSALVPRWSPDSNWLTWSRDLDTHVDAVFIERLGAGKPIQVTDGLAEATSPVFSGDGKHLFFLASTDTGLAFDFEDLSRLNAANSTENVFALVLRKNLPNPLQPESDEETPKDDKKPDAPKKEADKFDIDVTGLTRRIITLPFPKQHYTELDAGPAGTVFALWVPPRPSAIAPARREACKSSRSRIASSSPSPRTSPGSR